MVRYILPENLQYVEGSTYLYNTCHPDGYFYNEDTILDDGFCIGNYLAGANAFIRITAEVTNTNLENGSNSLVSFAQGQAGADENTQMVLQDCATVSVSR